MMMKPGFALGPRYHIDVPNTRDSTYSTYNMYITSEIMASLFIGPSRFYHVVSYTRNAN
jgi:hypothetical protein